MLSKTHFPTPYIIEYSASVKSIIMGKVEK